MKNMKGISCIDLLSDVMPPDEYQEHARNSIFTNLVANYAVNTARWLACLASAGTI